MRLCAKSSVMAIVLMACVSLYGQEAKPAHSPDLLARLSYDNSAALQTEGVRHVCIAVFRDGDYRIVRTLESEPAQRLQGTMSAEQLQQLRTLLESSDFRSLSGSQSGVIRESAETFAAEIPKTGKQPFAGTFLVQWLNADGENPFPTPVTKVVDWLNRFEPGHAKPFSRSEFQDVCPSAGMRLLQPSVAANVP